MLMDGRRSSFPGHRAFHLDSPVLRTAERQSRNSAVFNLALRNASLLKFSEDGGLNCPEQAAHFRIVALDNLALDGVEHVDQLAWRFDSLEQISNHSIPVNRNFSWNRASLHVSQ